MAPVGVAFGGPSPEHDISVLTGLQAAQALSRAGREVQALYWSRTGQWYEVGADQEAAGFASGLPKGASELSFQALPGGGFFTKAARLGRSRRLDLEAVVVCMHGGPGEDGTLQGAFDLAGLPYSGPTAAAAALGMDKLAFGALAAAAGLPTLPRALLSEGAAVGFAGPYIAKPRFGGSSIGIEVVEDLETAQALARTSRHLRRGAVIEPWRPDLFDLNVAVRTWPSLQLSAIERPLRAPGSGKILTYSDKYMGGEGMVSAPRELPAAIDPTTAARVAEIARALVPLAAIRGVARVDFLAGEDGELYLNELNTIPGSLSKYLWVEPPLAFESLLEDLLAEALRKPAAQYSTEGADGSALRAAGSIASKLA